MSGGSTLAAAASSQPTTATTPSRSRLSLLGRQLLRGLSPASLAGRLKAASTSHLGAGRLKRETSSAPPTPARHQHNQQHHQQRHRQRHLSRHSMACCLALGGSRGSRSPATADEEAAREAQSWPPSLAATVQQQQQPTPLEAAAKTADPPATPPAATANQQQQANGLIEGQPAAEQAPAVESSGAGSALNSPQVLTGRQSAWSWQTMRNLPSFRQSSRRKNAATAAQVDQMGKLIALLDLEHLSRQQQEAQGGGPEVAPEEELSEQSWRQFVSLENEDGDNEEDAEAANSRLACQQEAIWELLATEASYLSSLRVIINLFQATLLKLQQHSLLAEIDPNLVFSNLAQVYEANRSLWQAHLEPMLARARQARRPLEPRMMRSAFVQIKTTFGPYYRYCLDHSACLRYVKHQNRSNELFKVYLAWCEGQKECERLRLSDLLVKPMQRLTKYPLLLRAIARRTRHPDQLEQLEQMVSHMGRFVRSVDLELRRRDELERLQATVARIDQFDVPTEVYSDEVERLVRRHCHFQLAAPLFHCPHHCQRQLLLDSSSRWARQSSLGPLRFKDTQVSGKLDVVLLLFTDQLLICKQLSPPTTASADANHLSLGGGGGCGDRWSLRAKSSSHSVLAPPPPTQPPPPQRPARLEPPGGQQQQQQQRSRAGSQSWQRANIAAAPSELPAHLSLSPRAHSLNLQQREQHPTRPHPPHGSPPAPATSAASLSDEPRLAKAASWRRPCASQQPSCHNSQWSLAAARELFKHSSADSARSVGGLGGGGHLEAPACMAPASSSSYLAQLPAAEGEPPAGRLRAIRAPYPLDRLALYALRDGSGLLCCQLNDSLTPAATFVLYAPPAAPTSASDQPTAAATCQSSTTTQEEPARGWTQRAGSFSMGGAHALRRRASQSRQDWQASHHQEASAASTTTTAPAAATTPTRAAPPAHQLLQLIRQAQARLQLAADFHGVRELSPIGADSLSPACHRELQHLLQWDSPDPLEQPPPLASLNQNHNQSSPSTGSGQTLDQATQRALLDQLQLMRLNHQQQQPATAARPTGGARRLLSPTANYQRAATSTNRHLFARSTRLTGVTQQDDHQQQEQRQHMWLAGSGRQRGHSPTISGHLSTSSDSDGLRAGGSVDWAPPGSPQSSWSARSSPQRLHHLQQQQQHQQPLTDGDLTSASQAAATGEPAERRRCHLFSLKRQNVILSASGEQQHYEQQHPHQLACHSLVSLGPAPSTHTTERRILARLQQRAHTGSRSESQATTMDQVTSAAFDDSNDLYEPLEPPPPGGHAASFDLLSGVSLAATADLRLPTQQRQQQHHLEPRSASMETRPPPISVTLTLPNNDEPALESAHHQQHLATTTQMPRPDRTPLYLSLPPSRRGGHLSASGQSPGGEPLSPIHSVSVASPPACEPPPLPSLNHSPESSSPDLALGPPLESQSQRNSLSRLFRRLFQRGPKSPPPQEVPALSVSGGHSQQRRANWRQSSSSFELSCERATDESSLTMTAASASTSATASNHRRIGHWLGRRRHRRHHNQQLAVDQQQRKVATQSAPVSAAASRDDGDTCYRAGLISDVGCISNLVRMERHQQQLQQRRRDLQLGSSSSTSTSTSRGQPTNSNNNEPSSGYLGFHEKLQLHQRQQREEARRRQGRGRATRWAGRGD